MPVKYQVRKELVTWGVVGLMSSLAYADSIVTSNGIVQSNSINWDPVSNTATTNITGNAGSANTATTATTATNVVGGTANVSSLSVSGSSTLSGGAVIAGTTSINNNAGTASTSIGTGSTSGNVTIGGGSAGQTILLNGGTGGVQINPLASNASNTYINAGAANSGNVFLGSNTGTGSVNLVSGSNSLVINNSANTLLGITNINTSGAAATTIGSNVNTSPVSLISGNSNLVVGNNSVALVAGNTLASNGSSGTTGNMGSGGFVSYSAAQAPLVDGQSVGNRLTGASYVNKISGNTLIDGNLYINGTLNYVASDSAHTTVTDGQTSSGTSIVAAGQMGKVVNANGAISTGITSQATAALTVTNSLGNTHGVVVQENMTTISGGNYSSSMMLDDNGARFSNTVTGAPVTVTGVADGRNSFDAVNVRQFAGAIASASAMTNIPGVDTSKLASFGIGLGTFMGQNALAMGASYHLPGRGALKASVASGMGDGAQASVGVGAGWSW